MFPSSALLQAPRTSGLKDTVVPFLSVDASVQLCKTLCVCVCESLGRCVEVWHVQVSVTACTREGVCRAPISVPVFAWTLLTPSVLSHLLPYPRVSFGS